MPDRFKYSEVRQKIINALRTDLLGPQSENEILDENPKSSYIIGMLASQTEEKEASTAGEQEVDSDIAYGDSEDYTAGEDDDNEPIMTTSFKLPTSIGISFYIASSTKTINIDVNGATMFVRLRRELEKMAKSITMPVIPDSQCHPQSLSISIRLKKIPNYAFRKIQMSSSIFPEFL